MGTWQKGLQLVAATICAFTLTGGASSPSSTKWEKCVAADGTFSFHYPPGWSVREKGASIAVTKPSTKEVILVIRRPFHERQTATALAKEMVASFKTTKQNFVASGLRTDSDDAAYLEASFTRNGRKFHSCVLVLKSSKIRQAYWFQYEALASEYSGKHGMALLKRVVSTLAARHESQPPGAEEGGEEPSERTVGARKGGGGGGALVGTWADSDSFGDVVDAGTGAYIRSSYTGESYQFRENGTFWHLTIGSGAIISGVAVQEGDYVVKGNVVTLRSRTESWTPNPNKSGQKPAYRNKPVDGVNKFQFNFSGRNTLNFTELPYKTQWTYYRTRKTR